MKNNLMIYVAALCLMSLVAACGNSDIAVTSQTDKEVSIFPDYKEVTVPANIAPLNFSVTETDAANGGDYRLIVVGKSGSFQVKAGSDGLFDIPMKKWKKLLAENKGASVSFTIAHKEKGAWTAFKPFTMEVANEDIDSHLVYRLIAPGYEQWNKMGIYQRDLESYGQSSIYENKLTDYNCVNCHSFAMQSPDKMLLHSRAIAAGTVIAGNGRATKYNTKTDSTIAAMVYPYWHPSEKFIAASVNSIFQNFLLNTKGILEVFDTESDVVVMDIDKNQVFSCPALKSDSVYETFPSFSPDGKSLFFCSANAVDSINKNFRNVRYSLCRIDFDADNSTFGTEVDTLFNAASEHRSASFPRVSPDGCYLVATIHDYGTFPIWHKEADLYLFDLKTGEARPMEAANSEDTDSYHSWSSNSRWMAFSSRRGDGLYTRPYFTYIDSDGNAHKPFLLPQKNPKAFYNALMFSYNIPELVKGRVNVNQRDIATALRDTHGVDVTYRK